jgi:hypothetical protein
LNDLEVDHRSALNIDHVENVRRSISSIVLVAIDADDSWPLHLLGIFRGNLPGKCDDSGRITI